MNLGNLRKRIFFALWAAPLSWILVNSNFSLTSLFLLSSTSDISLQSVVIYPGHIIAIMLTIMACYEYLNMLKRLYHRNGFWLIYIWLGFQIVSYFLPDSFLSMRQDIFILLGIVVLEAFIWGKNTGRWKRASLLFSGTVFLMIACSSLLDFYDQPFQKIFAPRFNHIMLSQLGIVLVLTAIFLCDSIAYFAGNLFGKHHFSSISPKKTIEGSISGLVTAIAFTTVGWYFLADNRYPLILGIIMGTLIGIFAQFGDLMVSLMKRYFKVKDTSNIIPGHGGILDRFDSLFFTAPIINLFIIITEKIMG